MFPNQHSISCLRLPLSVGPCSVQGHGSPGPLEQPSSNDWRKLVYTGPPLLPLGWGCSEARVLRCLPEVPSGITSGAPRGNSLTDFNIPHGLLRFPSCFFRGSPPTSTTCPRILISGFVCGRRQTKREGQALCIRCRAGLTPGSHDPPKPIVGSPTWVCHLTVLRTSYWAQPQGRQKALCTLQWAEEGEGHQVKPPQSQQVLGTGAPKSLSGALGDQGWPTAQGVRPSHSALVQTPRVSGFAQPVSSVH